MKVDSSTRLYGLIGNPVEKSLSPEIHNMSFEQNDINAEYLAFKVEGESLEDAIDGVKALGIRGINVTIPHKMHIIGFLDELDREAELLGAVNTVLNVDGKLKGFNTDGRGFVELLLQNGVDLEGSKVAIVGAGGAARAIAISIGLSGASEITILNRTRERAEVLANEIGQKISAIEARSELDIKSIKDYDLLVNCTSVGMEPNVEDMPIELEGLSRDMVIADIVYKPLKTKLLREAERLGHKTIEGLGMLINQAILSEEIWFGRDFEKEHIIEHFNKRFK